jgi:hypothetical protein
MLGVAAGEYHAVPEALSPLGLHESPAGDGSGGTG